MKPPRRVATPLHKPRPPTQCAEHLSLYSLRESAGAAKHILDVHLWLAKYQTRQLDRSGLISASTKPSAPQAMLSTVTFLGRNHSASRATLLTTAGLTNKS